MKKRKLVVIFLLLIIIVLLFSSKRNVHATIGWNGPVEPYGKHYTDGTYEYMMGMAYVLSNNPNDERLTKSPNSSGEINNSNLRDRTTKVQNDDRRNWEHWCSVWIDPDNYYKYLDSGFDEYCKDDYDPFYSDGIEWGIQDGGSKIYTDGSVDSNGNIIYNRYRRAVLMIYRRPLPKSADMNLYIAGTDGGTYSSGDSLWIKGSVSTKINGQGFSYYSPNSGNQWITTKVQQSYFCISNADSSIDTVNIYDEHTNASSFYNNRSAGSDMIVGAVNINDYFSEWSGLYGNVVTNQLEIKPTYDMDLHLGLYTINKYGIWSPGKGQFWQSGGNGTMYNWLRVDCNAPTSNNVTATLTDSNTVRIDLNNCTDYRSGVDDDTVRVAIWRAGESYRDWYTLSRVSGTNNFTATINIENDNTKGQYGTFNAHVYTSDNVKNDGYQAAATFNRIIPKPINMNFKIKTFDYKEKDSNVYWMKVGNEFSIYNDGYFDSKYGMYPTRNYVLFQKDGIGSLDNSARYYSDINSSSFSGSEFYSYFDTTEPYNSWKLQRDGRNYIYAIHKGRGLVDGTKFLIHHCTTYILEDGTEYYSGYENPNVWMKFDGKPPDGNVNVSITYPNCDMTISASSVTDSGSGVAKVYAEYYDPYNPDEPLKVPMTKSGDNWQAIVKPMDHFNSDQVKIDVHACDNVGNDGIIGSDTKDLFFVEATICPYNHPEMTTNPILLRGQRGILKINTSCYVERLSIIFDSPMDNLDKEVTLTPKPIDNYTYEFNVPLEDIEDKQYTITVEGYRGYRTRTSIPTFIVRSSIVDGLKTRTLN